MTSHQSALLPLVAKLKACPTHDNGFSKELVRDAWEGFKDAWKPGNNFTPAVIAALVIHNSTFALLLDETERAQLLALSNVALERFKERTNPPNKLGKILAAILEIPT
jgi:hypothetical protein